MKKQVPNLITSANILCGSLAVLQIASGHYLVASFLILLAAFFDFFDGLAARLLKVESAMGAELDSLADVVSFGVAPAYLAVEWINFDHALFRYIPLLMIPFSAYRLAKFNIDERQTDVFIGLPTPANALFWVSLPLILWQQQVSFWWIDLQVISDVLKSPIVLLILSLVLCYLLIAELPLLALKFKNLNWKENKYRFILLLFSFLLISILGFAAIPFILLLYLILSIVNHLF